MYRNPSPPPQDGAPLDNVDRIGETAYSQCWVLKALVSLSSQSLKEDEQLSEELENEFCQLWDMSSDRQVGAFLLGKGVCDLMLAPLVRSNNYRVREVSLGIVGNLMCHKSHAKDVTAHTTLRTYIPTLMREDDVSVLTETVRLLRAALAQQSDGESEIADAWRKVLPDDIVERLIHIIQSTLKMQGMRSGVLTEHCAHMLELLFYQDDALVASSAYTVFPLVDILTHRGSGGLAEPLLRCLQYLSEENRAVANMTQCPGLPKVIHRVMSEKIEHSLVAVCLSLVCTLLSSSATDDVCAWLERDCNITDIAIRTLHRIILDDREEKNDATQERRASSCVEPEPKEPGHERREIATPTHNTPPVAIVGAPPRTDEVAVPPAQNPDLGNGGAAIEPSSAHTPTPASADRLRVEQRTPVRLVTPTYGTPCAVPTPTSQSAANTPQSTLSTPYSLQRRVNYTPSERIRRSTSEPCRNIIQVCREMTWNFLYTLANHIPQEGSCVLKYIDDSIKDLLYCFKSDGDRHVELAMLYKQHLEKYPHFAKSCSLLSRFITSHTIQHDT